MKNETRNDILNVGLVQPDLVWEDPESNLKLIQGMIAELPKEVDLVILPETFSTGFTMHADQYAEENGGRTLLWMQLMAKKKNAIVTGSLIANINGDIYNRLYWVTPEGTEGYYDKRHLFRMGREDAFFKAGKERKIVSSGSFRLMPQICYDLRFPVFSRTQGDYHILFYVANWPASRQSVWEPLLRARAIENQAFVVAVNRTGVDGEDIVHVGGTCIINPMGQIVASLDKDPGVLNYTIDLSKIEQFRDKFPVWKDADRFDLI